MGIYLNSITPYALYKGESKQPYFVDKSAFLEELFPFVLGAPAYLCLTRPRRFGKTIMANMIGSYFGRGQDSRDVFEHLEISRAEAYQEHINQYNVIYIAFNKIPFNCKTYDQYIRRISDGIIRDIRKAYTDYNSDDTLAPWDVLSELFEAYQEQFIFILDEWDFIFHQNFVSEDNRQDYIIFLNTLLKDQAYVSLAYMTGVLPISKYSSGSELNMFLEFSMINSKAFSNCFGFVETEVDELYLRYLKRCSAPLVTRDGLRIWYNGYHTAAGERVYNPRSVVNALRFDQLGSYWTSTGPYDEIYYYVKNNIADVRAPLALMVAGEAVPAKVQEYATVSMNLHTKDEIFSAMVVYGFLSFSKGMVSIPNKELMDKFEEVLIKEVDLGYVYRLAKASEQMLNATIAGDTDTMEVILEYAHDTESPILTYNHEIELSAIVNLVYLSARDKYRMEREDKAGKGYVDFIFYPLNSDDDCIILELKVDATAEKAIAQIKERNYALRFLGKLGEKRSYKGRILAVGIGYYKDDKKHECRVEVLS
jgi:hypothetical protein